MSGNRRLFLVFLLGVVVCITPAFERLYPGVFRHLMPVYLTIFALCWYTLIHANPGTVLRVPAWMRSLTVLLGVVAFGILSTAWMEAAQSEWMRLFYIAVSFLLFWRICLNDQERKWGAWGLVVGSIIFIYTLVRDNLGSLLDIDSYVTLINRNLTGSILVSGFAGLFFIVRRSVHTGILLRMLYIALAVVYLYFIVVTFSRSTILTLGAFLIGFIVADSRLRWRYWGLGLGVLGFMFISTIENFQARLKLRPGADIEYVSSGRSDIWHSILMELPSTGYMGVGSANSRYYLSTSDHFLATRFGRTITGSPSPHNMGLKLLFENGIPGFFVYLLFLLGLLAFAWRHRHRSPFFLSSCLSVVTFIQFHDYTMAPWFLAALFVPAYEIKRDTMQVVGRGRPASHILSQ